MHKIAVSWVLVQLGFSVACQQWFLTQCQLSSAGCLIKIKTFFKCQKIWSLGKKVHGVYKENVGEAVMDRIHSFMTLGWITNAFDSYSLKKALTKQWQIISFDNSLKRKKKTELLNRGITLRIFFRCVSLTQVQMKSGLFQDFFPIWGWPAFNIHILVILHFYICF